MYRNPPSFTALSLGCRLSRFLSFSFTFCPTQLCGGFLVFLDVWSLLLTISSCSVWIIPLVDVFSMFLREKVNSMSYCWVRQDQDYYLDPLSSFRKVYIHLFLERLYNSINFERVYILHIMINWNNFLGNSLQIYFAWNV